MPVFSKGLRCSRTGGSRSDRHRSSGRCGGSTSSDEENDNRIARAAAGTCRPTGRNNAELETAQRGSGIDEDQEDDERDDFRFLLTVSDLQLAPESAIAAEDVEPLGALEFEHADTNAEVPEAADSPPKQKAKQKPKKAVAKSSCGKASSNEDDEVTSEEDPKEPPAEPPAEEFLILLTAILAHGPPPPDDFRFFLTVHQAEAAT